MQTMKTNITGKAKNMMVKAFLPLCLFIFLPLLSSCTDEFLDLKPLDQETDVVYFKKAGDFKDYATSFYNSQLLGWNSTYNSIYSYFDGASDLSCYFSYNSDLAHGTISVPSSDVRWDNCYKFIRSANILLQRGESYGNKAEIAQYLGEAYFFRAYSMFWLLKTFGGVPIVTTVLDTDSPELYGERNSRYEVTDQILSDLDEAIADLPKKVSNAERGRITSYAAEAFKARVLLYEATWRKYNGTSTDFEGSAGPASDQVNDFLDECIRLTDDVMTNGGYSLWNYNNLSSMQNMSSRYLFCLEDATSNPAGLDKSTNNEFIIDNVYDHNLRPGGMNINQTVGYFAASRKFMDMFLCTDGLPISKSRRFQGYAEPGDEFKNRDYRMKSYINMPSADMSLNNGTSGYPSHKFYDETPGVIARQESADYPVLRLAEVYLTYAEALYERNGAITDAQLNRSINQLRARAGVASLTNKLVADNGLDMKTEIRRERTIEMYMEGCRFDDLKRWGIAEQELNQSRLGMVVGGVGYPTHFRNADGSATEFYEPNRFVYGEEACETPVGTVSCIALEKKADFNFTKKHYLWPIPQHQIDLNKNLKQNPGY